MRRRLKFSSFLLLWMVPDWAGAMYLSVSVAFSAAVLDIIM